MRNFFATLLLSQGTPMILAGDEFARTQQGNNNAYCQDNEVSWVDWGLREKHQSLVAFVSKLTALRHKYPILRRKLFLNGEYLEDLGVRDVTWVNQSGAQMSEEDWHNPDLRCFGMLLDGRAQVSGIRQQGKNATILLVFNENPDAVDFRMPECVGGCEWRLLLDTNAPDEEGSRFAVSSTYVVTGRSVIALELAGHSSDLPAVKSA